MAWGFYAVIIIVFLHSRVMDFIDSWSFSMGSRICTLILGVVTVDYIIQLMNVLHIDISEQKERLIDRYHEFKTRWY